MSKKIKDNPVTKLFEPTIRYAEIESDAQKLAKICQEKNNKVNPWKAKMVSNTLRTK